VSVTSPTIRISLTERFISINAEPAGVYPTMPFAPTGSRELRTNHVRFAGSVSIDTETFQAVMRQVAQSALAAGFKNVFLMGDHGGGQDALRAAAKDLEDQYDKLDETAHIYYVPDLYYKEKQQMKAYLAERGVPYDAHAGTDDTSEVMFLDAKKWIRSEKLRLSTEQDEPTTGVNGDPTTAMPELGKMFIGFNIDDAVNQIHPVARRAGEVTPLSERKQSQTEAVCHPPHRVGAWSGPAATLPVPGTFCLGAQV